MSMIKKMATAGAVAAIGLGLGASSASAYAITGGSYTSTASATHRFTVGGSYTITCTSAVFSGSATGAASTTFTPAYTGCRFLGFASTVTQSGSWNITVTGDNGAGTYTGNINIPSGTTTTINVPLAACTVVVSGPQTFTHGVNSNVGSATNFTSGTGVNLTATVNNVAYTSSGSCPWGTGSFTNGTYTTGGATAIPGITVS